MVSSRFLMKTGILRAPGDFRMRVSWVMVCWRIWGGQISILVITTITGTFRAKAMPKCSLNLSKSLLFTLRGECCILAHPNEAIICSDHEKAVIWAATQQPKDCCA